MFTLMEINWSQKQRD